MKNDLISRSALMNHLRGNVFVDVTPALEQAVKDEPTAYDVDKVVKEIEEISQYDCSSGEIIWLVKAGGVNE